MAQQELWQYNPSLEKPVRDGMFSAGGIVFQPGINRVDGGAIAQLKEIPAVKLRINMGILTPVTPTEEKQAIARGEDVPQEPSITDFKVLEAVGMIENTADLALLKKWRSEDTRLGVQRAIAARIDALDPPIANEQEL